MPPAYDEQYAVLLRELPHSLRRVPAAAGALFRHAVDLRAWGGFWPATALAAVVARSRTPLIVIALTLLAYTATFAVTSWDIAELAGVAANRLLTHLIVPACWLLAHAHSKSSNGDSSSAAL